MFGFLRNACLIAAMAWHSPLNDKGALSLEQAAAQAVVRSAAALDGEAAAALGRMAMESGREKARVMAGLGSDKGKPASR